jgi:hypothetical protein
MRAKAFASSLAYLFVGVLALACGDDSDGTDGGAGDGAGAGGTSGGTSGGGSGGRDPFPTPDGGLPDAGPGDGEEGFPCSIVDDCGLDEDGEQFACVASGGFNFGICARSCTGDEDCGSELCVSYSGLAADAHCIDLVNTEFAECGVVFTSDCAEAAGLTCLYLPDQPFGVCSTLCMSSDEDGGVPDPVCDEDQFCRGGTVSDNGSGIDGVCGTHAARGEECGIFMGAFCGVQDICTPNDIADENSPFSCHQNCTEDGSTCDTGTCTQFRGLFFCL